MDGEEVPYGPIQVQTSSSFGEFEPGLIVLGCRRRCIRLCFVSTDQRVGRLWYHHHDIALPCLLAPAIDACATCLPLRSLRDVPCDCLVPRLRLRLTIHPSIAMQAHAPR